MWFIVPRYEIYILASLLIIIIILGILSYYHNDPGLKTLVLGEYLPDLMITEDVQRVERELLDLLGRSDVVSVDESGLWRGSC